MKLTPGRAFTLVEILVVAACLVVILGPIVLVIRSGSKASLKGMVRIDTTLEGRRIIQQLRADLKQACYPGANDSQMRFTFNDLLQRSGSAPEFTFQWLSFPKGGSLREAVDDSGSGKARRLASRIIYRVEAGPARIAPFRRLVREEYFHPDHPHASRFPGGIQRKVLSSRVNYLDIKPHVIQSGETSGLFWWVTMQLGDLPGVSPDRRHDPGRLGPADIILADFFDLVSPEFFRALMRDPRTNPNWHSVISGP